MKTKILGIAAILTVQSIFGLYAQRTITQPDGRKVTVPDHIERIADGWPAHNMIVAMLGYGDNIVATVVTEKMCPWFFKLNPSIKNAVNAFNQTDIAYEEVIATKPDVVFMHPRNMKAQHLQDVDLHLVNVPLTNFETMKVCVLKTGEVLGDSAYARAEMFVKYLNNNADEIKTRIKDVKDSDKPRVLHLESVDPFSASGKGSMIDAWITTCGGINVASDFQGTRGTLSPEQILKWNPDIITFEHKKADDTVDKILNNPILQNVNAIKNKRVYRNPKGMFAWDRYSAEEALQIQWAAKIFYPEKFKDYNILQQTIEFYKIFFRYTLSEDEAIKIIKGIPPSNN